MVKCHYVKKYTLFIYAGMKVWKEFVSKKQNFLLCYFIPL